MRTEFEVRDQATRDAEPAPMRPFSRSLPMALLRAREAAMRLFRPSLQAHELTEQQWRVLRAIAAAEAVEATQLARLTFLLAPSLTRILRDLETRKLIRRRANPSDRRAAEITLSARGLELMRAVGPESERIYKGIEAKLGEARLSRLMELLAEVETLLGEGD
jgi:homoprotocatechuate degradation regulator HpaR